jgi:hypothetical protein
MNLIKKVATVLAASFAVSVASAQDYSVLAQTRTAPGGGLADRLFTDNSFTTLAPNGRIIWFVADALGNGVPTSPIEGSILGSDDTIIFQDIIDGGILGTQNGRYSRAYNNVMGVPLAPDSTRNASIVMYLWNVSTVQSVPITNGFFTPVAGNTFGIFNIGNVTEPAVGDALWEITSNVSASQFTVAAIPEPSTYALGGLGLISLALYRRMKKR